MYREYIEPYIANLRSRQLRNVCSLQMKINGHGQVKIY